MKGIRFSLVMAFAFSGSSFSCFSQAVQSHIDATNSPTLLPVPREYSSRGVALLPHGVSITSGSDPEDVFAARDLAQWLAGLDVRTGKGHSAFHIELLRGNSHGGEKLLAGAEEKIDPKIDPEMHEEGYLILPSAHGVAVIADTAAGVFYGVQTLKQLVNGRGAEASFDRAQVRDWPAMRYRGLSDDLSRGPIPTLDFQKREIRTLAAYKMNVYSPYFENTLQYSSTPLTALPGGAMSPADVRMLVDYARQYHVMIVPEQESFGHLHHLLIYEQYAPLAETPLGNVLAPGEPGSLDLIGQWFGEIGKLFPSPFIHVGADEVLLGKGRTKDEVDAKGSGTVYLDFLLQIHDKLAPLQRRLLFWGDVAMNDPSQVQRIPKDMIAVAWTYGAQPNGYARWLTPYTDAGLETWVAPGVSNTNRVYPDNNNALLNIQRFVSDGQAARSTGMLNTVWNDDGEGLSLQNWYGVLFGAAVAWQPGTSSIEQFQAAYGRVFHRDTTGKIDQAQRELISIYQMLDEAKAGNTDSLFWADPWSPEGQAMAAQLRPMVNALRLHAERAITLVAQARAAGPLRENDALDALDLGARKLDFIGQKFETADDIARLYNEAYASVNSPDPQQSKQVSTMLYPISYANGLCHDMRDGYSLMRASYSSLWLEENRPYWLQNVLVRYDLATQLWVLRGNRFVSARDDWSAHHSLPAPAELGIPGH